VFFIYCFLAFLGYVFSCVIADKVMRWMGFENPELVPVFWPLALVVAVAIVLPICAMLWLVNDLPKKLKKSDASIVK
jgi:hypothetical protein